MWVVCTCIGDEVHQMNTYAGRKLMLELGCASCLVGVLDFTHAGMQLAVPVLVSSPKWVRQRPSLGADALK